MRACYPIELETIVAQRILDMKKNQRPRERLMDLGPSALSDTELIAVLMGTGTAGRGVVEDADALLVSTNGLVGLANIEVKELLRRPGFGEAKSCLLVAALELGKRLARAEIPLRQVLDHPKAASAYLTRRFLGERREVFGFLSLNSRHSILDIHELYNGTKNQAPVEPGEVFRQAVLDDASSILLFHNHPSTDPSPSRDDLALTKRLIEAGRMIGVDVVDHLIIAGQQCISLRTTHPSTFGA